MRISFLILLVSVAPDWTGGLNEKLLPIANNVKIVRTISSCIEEAARTLFVPWNDVSMIVCNLSSHQDLVQEILQGSFANRITKIFTKLPNESKDKSHLLVRKSSFVLIDHSGDIRQLLKNFFVNRWAEYIIVTEATTQWLAEFASYLWNLGFVNVAFLKVTPIGESSLLRLIQEPSSRDSSPTLVTYDLCNGESSSEQFGGSQRDTIVVHPFSSLFHISANASLTFARILEGTGDQVDFGRVRSDGVLTSLGVDVMKIFTTKYNIELIRHEWKSTPESNWTDAMYECVAGEFDFFYARQSPSRSFSRGLVDAVAWYKYESLVFVDSLKLSLHTFSGLLVPYNGIVWFCSLMLLGAYFVFAYAIDALHRLGLIHEHITPLTIWSVYVNQSLPGFPTKFSLRFVIGMWILHNLINNSLYTAKFSSGLTATDSSNLLRSFQDVLDTGRPICGGSRDKELFNDGSDPQMLAIYNRLEVIVPKYAFSKILNEGYISTRQLSYVEEHNWINRNNDSLRIYSLAKAVILRYPSFFYAKKHHPYSKEFNRVVSIIRDAGLVGYLNNQYQRTVFKTKKEVASLTTSGELLKLKHLAVVFHILLIGHLVSFVVFFIELCVHMISNNYYKRRK